MISRSLKLILITAASISILISCGSSGDDSGSTTATTITTTPYQCVTDSSVVRDTTNDSTFEAELTDKQCSFTYTKDLGVTPKDVYFVFTNDGISDTTRTPQVSSTSSPNNSQKSGNAFNINTDISLSEFDKENGIALRGIPEATAFNENPPTFKSSSNKNYNNSFIEIPDPVRAAVNDTFDFIIKENGTTKAATLRKQVIVSGITLNIWVADDSYAGGSCNLYAATCLTDVMLTAFADKFLLIGADNDIYDWITNIYGLPWGNHSYDYYIPSTAQTEIDILFKDIDNDANNTLTTGPNGGVVGYFWAKDNYKKVDPSYPNEPLISYSNERLIFYMDAYFAAKDDGVSGWQISDYWPAEVVSTLTHEFQHMIHFYQKSVFRESGGSETWINEMASMGAEDLIADKLDVIGPRGVSGPTAGSSGNTSGRLPSFINSNYRGVSDWYTGNDVFISYALNYAFGAYLSRNFGGAAFFQKMVQNDKTNYQAIESALDALGYSNENFESVLRKWAVATILSDQTTTPLGYRFNTGAYMTSTIGSITYNLGSINMYNYDYESLSGPSFFNTSNLSNLSTEYKTSNIYYKAGVGLTGAFSKDITLYSGVKFSLILK